MAKPHIDTHSMILEAQRKGFTVTQDDDGGWWVNTPRRPRRPSVRLGEYKDPHRAWIGAALEAQRYD